MRQHHERNQLPEKLVAAKADLRVQKDRLQKQNDQLEEVSPKDSIFVVVSNFTYLHTLSLRRRRRLSLSSCKRFEKLTKN